MKLQHFSVLELLSEQIHGESAKDPSSWQPQRQEVQRRLRSKKERQATLEQLADLGASGSLLADPLVHRSLMSFCEERGIHADQACWDLEGLIYWHLRRVPYEWNWDFLPLREARGKYWRLPEGDLIREQRECYNLEVRCLARIALGADYLAQRIQGLRALNQLRRIRAGAAAQSLQEVLELCSLMSYFRDAVCADEEMIHLHVSAPKAFPLEFLHRAQSLSQRALVICMLSGKLFEPGTARFQGSRAVVAQLTREATTDGVIARWASTQELPNARLFLKSLCQIDEHSAALPEEPHIAFSMVEVAAALQHFA